MINIFLSGDRGCGKSTLLGRVIELLDCPIGGFVEDKIGTADGVVIDMVSLYNGSFGNVIGRKFIKSDRVINKDVFENTGVDILSLSCQNRCVIVMDELGFFEADCRPFVEWVNKILDSEKLVVGVIRDQDNDFLNSIRSREDTVVFTVTRDNRNEIFEKIARLLSETGIPLKTRHRYYSDNIKVERYNEALDNPLNSYPAKFISEIRRYAGSFSGMDILDIGAGTGAFAIPFIEEGANVTCVDSSYNMFRGFIRRERDKGLNGSEYILSPWHYYKPRKKFDFTLCAFCNTIFDDEDEFYRAIKCTAGYVFIVVPYRRFDSNFNSNVLRQRLGRPLKQHCFYSTDVLMFMDRLGIGYCCSIIDDECSQYFSSYDEVQEFVFYNYGINSEEEKKIARDFIYETVEITGGKYILHNKKSGMLITVKMGQG